MYFRDVNEMIEEVKVDFQNKTGHELTDMEISYDVTLYTFPQTWGSTALGFDGYGCQMITQAQTTVILVNTTHNYGAVFFGGKFAYSVENFNEAFIKDVSQFRMEPVYRAGKYLEKVTLSKNKNTDAFLALVKTVQTTGSVTQADIAEISKETGVSTYKITE